MTSSQSQPLPPYLRSVKDGSTLAVRAQPNARKTAVVGVHGEMLKIQVQSPPVDGRANETLKKWLASVLGLAKSEVTLIRGASSRDKVFHFKGKTTKQIFERLSAILPKD